jgi:hypothetical protein
VLPWSDVDHGEVKQVGVRIITIDFKNFGNEASSGTTFDLHNHVERIADIGLNGAKANVNPDTTMATSDSPRAMVVVNACCRTLAAFSQGEFACAREADTRNRVMKSVKRARTKIPKRNRENFADTSASRIEIWSGTLRLASGFRIVRRYLGHPGRNRRCGSSRVSMEDRSLFIYSASQT